MKLPTFLQKGGPSYSLALLFYSPMLHVPMFCYSLCIVIHVFHFSLALMFLCALLLPYFIDLPCFVVICFNVLCFTTSPCFVTPMLHAPSCFIVSPMFCYSCGLPLPCFMLFIVSLLMCDIAFVLHSSHVLLLVTLLLLCDVTLMFHYSRASSLFCALGTFFLLVASLCPCVLPLLCFTTHVFCYTLFFVVHFSISVLPPFTFLSFWNFAQGV